MLGKWKFLLFLLLIKYFFCNFADGFINYIDNPIMALKGKYEQAHWAVKVIQWLGCMFLLSIVAGISVFFFEQPLSTEALKWIQFVQQTALFLLPPLCMAYLWSKQPMEWLRVKGDGPLAMGNGRLAMSNGLWAMALMLVALPAINLLGYWNQQLTLPAFLEPLEQWMKTQEESAKILTEQFMNVTTIGGLIINLLLMALLPAIAEELTFRGVLQRLFQAKGEKGDEAKRRENTTPDDMVQCDTILSDTLAVLRLRASYANGCAVWLYVSMDGQPMDTHPDALYQQRYGSAPLLRYPATRLGHGESRCYRHKRHPMVGCRQYGDNYYRNLCFSSLNNNEQCLFANVQWQLNIAQLNATHPARNILGL